MKNYLVLINNRSESTRHSASEQFDYYRSWGEYLSCFGHDSLLHGGPLGERAFSLMSKTQKNIEEKHDSTQLKAYMVLRAESEHEIKSRLLDCPAFDRVYTQMNIFEIDMHGII